MQILRAVLGWSNPGTGPENLRLYALDKGDSPRWDGGGRVVEKAIIERDGGMFEGDRYLVVHLGNRFFDKDQEDVIIKTLEDLFGDPKED